MRIHQAWEKWKILYRRSGIYKKIIAYFLILSLLTGVVCTGVHQQGYSIIRNEISNVIQEKNTGNVNNVYNICQQIRMLLYEFGTTDYVLDLIILDHNRQLTESEKSIQERQLIQNIQELLGRIWKGNSMIAEVMLLHPNTGTVITTGSSRAMGAEEEALLAYYKDNLYYSDLFSYEDKKMIMMEYLLGEYYVCAELTDYAWANSFLGYGKEENHSFLYNIREMDSIGAAQPEIVEYLQTQNWKKSVGKVVTQKGCRFVVSEIERSDYVSITYYEEKELYETLNFYQFFYWILLIIIVLGAIFFSRWLYALLHRPLQILLGGLEKVRKGNLDTEIVIKRQDEFQEIYQSFNSMTFQLKQLIEKTYQQERLLHKSELKQLQSQIAPHFLYNSFIVLSNRIHAEDYEFAAEFSNELGKYFMFLTRNGREYVPLEEELGHAFSYARIQQVRFRNRVRLQLDELSKEWTKVMVPRLIIQPVFENVFKYVVDKSGEMVTIHIGYEYLESEIHVMIENSGSITEEELAVIDQKLGKVDDEIHGMANIHQRLCLIYDGEGGIELDRSELGGLRVTLRLQREIPEGEGNVQDFVGR